MLREVLLPIPPAIAEHLLLMIFLKKTVVHKRCATAPFLPLRPEDALTKRYIRLTKPVNSVIIVQHVFIFERIERMGTKPRSCRKIITFLFSLTLCMFLFPSSALADKEEALQTAKEFLETMPFSRSGLISQLEFAGYSASESEYAADNSGADWNEMAVLSAESYLSSSDYSEKGLINLLESAAEGYTHDQAVYGVSVAGKDVDWNEMAANRAAFYLRSSAFSKNGLIKQLESERVGFTHEQAVYGAEAAGKDVDWDEMAVKRARSILEHSPMSETGLIRQLESESLGFTHEQAAAAVTALSDDIDWFEMAAEKAISYLQVTSYKRSELIELLESNAEGFTHEQAVYGADNSGASWGDMITVLSENLDNLYPIHGMEENFMTPAQALYSDIGPETALEISSDYGLRHITLFSNPDMIHDRSYIERINAGQLDNFMFTMDVVIRDVYPADQAGCYIGYTNDLASALKHEDAAQVFLMADKNGIGFYRKFESENSGTFTRISASQNDQYTLSIVRFTGQTYAYINGQFAGQFTEVIEGPFQLVYGAAALKEGDTASCSFDNLSVRKVNMQ